MSVDQGSIKCSLLAHGFGSTKIASIAQKSLVSCSDDCHLCVYQKFPQLNNETRQQFELESSILCLDVQNQLACFGLDDGSVQLMDLSRKDLQPPEMVLRCTLPVRSVSVNPSSGRRQIAIAADDMALKLYDCDTRDIFKLTGHDKSVKCLRFSPNGSMLACAGCDGVLYVFRTGDQNLLHKSSKLFAPSDPEDSQLQISWSPDGNVVAVPCQSSVKLYDCRKWQVISVLQVGVNCNVVELSPDSQFVVSGEDGGLAKVWDLSSGQLLAQYTSDHSICSALWRFEKQSVFIAFGDSNGQIVLWKDPVTVASLTAARNDFVEDKVAEHNDINLALQAVEDAQAQQNSLLDDIAAHYSNEDDEKAGNHDVDIEMDMDDIFSGLNEYPAAERDDEEELQLSDRRNDKSQNRIRVKGGHEIPKSFQPNSTPYKNDRRYLVYNMHGSVDAVKSDSHVSITVEFHDISQRSVNIKAIFPYDFGTLSADGVLLASNKLSEDEDGAVLYYRPFENWSNTSEWTLYLPVGEQICCICVGKYVVAVSQLYMRIFSLSGLQLYVLCSLPNVISIAQHESLIFIVYFDNAYRMQLYDLKLMKIEQDVPLPLAGSSLNWIGFSEDGLAGIYDSNATLMAFMPHMQQWVPLVNTKQYSQGKTDYYWPVSFNQNVLSVVICKAGDRYPSFPRPIMTDLQISLPTIPTPQASDDQLRLEQQMLSTLLYLKSSYNDTKQTALMDKTLLQLIQICGRQQKIAKCIDLCQLIIMDKSLELAFKLAQRMKLNVLASAIESMVIQRHEEQQTQLLTAPVIQQVPMQQDQVINQAQTLAPAQVILNPKRLHDLDEIQPPPPNATPRRPQRPHDDGMFISPSVIPSDDVVHRVPPPNPFKKKSDSSPFVNAAHLDGNTVFDSVEIKRSKLAAAQTAVEIQKKGTNKAASVASAVDSASNKRRKVVQKTLAAFTTKNTLTATSLSHSSNPQTFSDDDGKENMVDEGESISLRVELNENLTEEQKVDITESPVVEL